ncbi:MAG: hypothetical protein Q4G64_01970, partial [bacterium]|nr:hypothetical protein [bacterium]
RRVTAGRRALEILVILVCCLLLAMVNAYTRDRAPGVHWYSGPPGRAVETPPFDITVTDVRLADRVTQDTIEFGTSEVLVVVEWTAEVRGGRALLAGIELHTAGGTTVLPRAEFLYSAGPAVTEAGFTRHATSVFQVEEDAAVGSDFVVHFNRGFTYTYTGAVRVVGVVGEDTPHMAIAEIADPRLEVTP